jgi:hypothetical protein
VLRAWSNLGRPRNEPHKGLRASARSPTTYHTGLPAHRLLPSARSVQKLYRLREVGADAVRVGVGLGVAVERPSHQNRAVPAAGIALRNRGRGAGVFAVAKRVGGVDVAVGRELATPTGSNNIAQGRRQAHPGSTRNATARVLRFLSEPQRGSNQSPGSPPGAPWVNEECNRSRFALPLETPTGCHIKAQGRRQAHPGSTRNATARVSRFLSEPQRGSTSKPRVAARRTLALRCRRHSNRRRADRSR